ncbi:MAG: nucleotidyl transferase AbiEii/AbiGii toxin family protein [Actinobacteria bacterium]|nr:nucleotidyl transferase AbiEii/AbiGii toxin family protein [Actinomycetota bacterium]MCL5882921.1 nucleotidyl transferase AbiEii/AbiGii toxin family protein [Actinomycetota bacterium]
MSDKVIEKDYVITWILLALSDSSLKEFLVFKGGTALKKIYFPDYRYSEDLDFTLRKEIANKELLARLDATLDALAKEQGFQFDIPPEKIEERADSLTAYVNFVGPLQARLDSRSIKLDFTLTEKLIFPIEAQKIHSPFSDAVRKKFATYSLEEILVEKLCAIIGRTEPRDIYDVNYLFGVGDIDFHKIPDAFREKAEFKGIDPERLSGSLNDKKDKYERMWETRLKHQIKHLPHLAEVLRELNRNLRKYDL